MNVGLFITRLLGHFYNNISDYNIINSGSAPFFCRPWLYILVIFVRVFVRMRIILRRVYVNYGISCNITAYSTNTWK